VKVGIITSPTTQRPCTLLQLSWIFFQFVDFLESNFLGEQVDSIKEISNYVHVLQRLNSAFGEYQFDKLTLGGGKD
jgi:hypothetical protein